MACIREQRRKGGGSPVKDVYLTELRRAAVEGGLDATRLMEEIDDHRREATASYIAVGHTQSEARRLAERDLGDPREIVDGLMRGGTSMRNRIRLGAIVIGFTASVTLWLAHAVPSGDLDRSGYADVSVAALVTTVVAALALVATTSAGLAVTTAFVSGVALWAVFTSAAFELGIVVVSGGHWLTLALTALAFACAARLLGARSPVGVGLMTAGLASLVLNGAHENYGGLGDGQGNIGVFLLTTGWLWLAISMALDSWGRGLALRTRRRVAGWFEGAARRIERDDILVT